jgi:hypothetical protein
MSDVKIRMKTHKLTLHCRNNDILFLRKDKYSKQACYTFKFRPEIKILLKLRCQETTCITNKTREFREKMSPDYVSLILWCLDRSSNSETKTPNFLKIGPGLMKLWDFKYDKVS